jgi:hypothetical protein
MNSATFDEYGRMTANLGLEAPGATPLLQNIILYPYVNPSTELLDASKLPNSLDVTPISTSDDGTQIWKITHNGVDTHPIHFHLFDVQILNRVTWDGINIPPEPSELGWKDTVRVSPLEDTIVAVRPIVPTLPFGVPDSHRVLNPMMPLHAKGDLNGAQNGQEAGFNNTGTDGNPLAAPVSNEVVDMGWEYVYHCHILSHEEMDMMRPVNVHVPSDAPEAPLVQFARTSARSHVDLTWTDGTPIDYLVPSSWIGTHNEIGYRIERATVLDGPFTEIGTALANATAFTDAPPDPTSTYFYRVTAYNEGGTGVSLTVEVPGLPAAPSNLTATVSDIADGLHEVALEWTDPADPSVTGIVLERAVGNGAYTVLADLTAADPTTFVDTPVTAGVYHYRIHAVSPAGDSADAVADPDPVLIGNSTTTVTAAPAAQSTVGQSVTFSAAITTSPALLNAATGTVTFTVNGVATVVPVVDGAAALDVASLPAGDYTVAADYSGDALYPPSSGSVSHTVVKQMTSLALGSSANPSPFGDPITFTATLDAPAATGGVTLTIDGGTPASVTRIAPLANGIATFEVKGLLLGDHTIAAAYGGDAAHAPSSAQITQSMSVRPTVTTVTSSRNPSTVGQSVTFTATVSAGGVGLVPTGSVQFVLSNGPQANIVASVPLDGQGVARYTTSNLLVGSHAVYATYGRAAPFEGSRSTTLTQVVNRIPTSLALSSNRAPSVYGQAVTFTATVSQQSAGGTVTFVVDGTQLVNAVVGTNGQATWTTSTLSVKSHTVVAKFSGSTLYAPSNSATFAQVVGQARSRVTLTSSLTPSRFGQAVTFTAVVTAVSPGVGTPTGNVQFKVDGVLIGAVTLVHGRAGVITSSIPRGNHTVTAVYMGNVKSFSTSTASITQRVQ